MTLGVLIRDQLNFLCFRGLPISIKTAPYAYLAFGLIVTWLAGIGRYWDHPDAIWFQYFGLGSVAYVFTLAAILLVVLWPLRAANATYLNLLIFVTLTSAPALLYAIPVERFTPLETARSLNMVFLLVVAAWRVGLLVWFLRKVTQLSPIIVLIAALLPLALIIVTLAALNLQHVVFEIMAGIQNDATSPEASSYGVIVGLALLSWLLSPVLILSYAVAVLVRRGWWTP